MSKRAKPKHSRGATRSQERSSRRLERIGNEGILSKREVESGLKGVGFAHRFSRASNLEIDRNLLSRLGVDEGESAPYQVPQPRHVTSIPHLSLDEYALRFLDLGRDTADFLTSLRAKCRTMDEATTKRLSCVVTDIHEIGGRRVIAEVDNARVSKIRGGIKALFEQAGVAIPEMYAPHFVVGHADSFREQRRIVSAAAELFVGTCVDVDDASIYTRTYTELERPVAARPPEG